jgi:hypothetical protein
MGGKSEKKNMQYAKDIQTSSPNAVGPLSVQAIDGKKKEPGPAGAVKRKRDHAPSCPSG